MITMKNLLILLSVLFLFGCSEQETELKPEKASIRHEVELDKDNYNVAFLIMDGTNVFTVANTNEPITTFEGLRILPDFNYLEDKLPQIDILVIPSAEHNLDSDLEDSKMIDFVRRVSKNARFVTSHCDGAFVLAQAGVLDGRVSTTFPADIEAMRKMFPQLDIRDETLFVHDGNVITSAGGAKSFEASLYLCELLYGKVVADQIAEGMVIDWGLSEVPHTIVDVPNSMAMH
jgi:transcriptional regulator GlxA family with amidase domain